VTFLYWKYPTVNTLTLSLLSLFTEDHQHFYRRWTTFRTCICEF